MWYIHVCGVSTHVVDACVDACVSALAYTPTCAHDRPQLASLSSFNALHLIFFKIYCFMYLGTLYVCLRIYVYAICIWVTMEARR